MTKYQEIRAARTAENIRKIIEAAQSPITFKEIAAATGLAHCNVRTLIFRHIEYFKCLGKTLDESGNHKKSKIWQARCNSELEPDVASNGTIYRLQDDDRYHDNMRMLRQNRKTQTVYVAGSTLSQ